MKNLNVLGVCAAQGALLLPFKQNLIANVEPRAVFHSAGEPQWKLNFGKIPFVRNLDPIHWDDQPVDVIIGSPSCGHSSVFSYSRKKTLGEPKSDLTLNLFVAAVKQELPKIFLMENLPQLLKAIPVSEWEENLPEYELIVHCHSVMAFGNSQKSRKRLVLIGVRKDSGISKSYFEKIFQVNTPMKIEEILEKVNTKINYREDPNKKLAMYHYNDPTKSTLTVRQVRKLWRGEFKKEYKWPMKTQRMKTLPGVYRNRPNTYPLTVRPSSRQFMPNGKMIGLDEYRIIMGFPKKFMVHWDTSNPGYWLNKGRNTLTKGATYEIGIWFKKCLKQAIK